MTLSGCAVLPWKHPTTDSDGKTDTAKADSSSADSGARPGERRNAIPIPQALVPAFLRDPGPGAIGVTQEMDRAMDLFRKEDYAQAQGMFHKITQWKNTPPRVAEEALYYEAECMRMQQDYPNAASTYAELVKEFHRGAHHYDALHHMFDIANYWLDETRDAVEARNAQRAGKRWIVLPTGFVHIGDKTKPFLDLEGHAMALLEKIYLNDIDGPLGEKALFLLGSVNFFHENYREADHFFYQLTKFHPNGDKAAQAMELSIICKQLSSGGVEYDGRKVAEARELVHTAMKAYPELANQKSEFLEKQLYTINAQQAQKDLYIADFYWRTGHPGSAYFYYEIVRRRYPGTKQAETAAKHMEELRDRAEKNKDDWTQNLWDNMQFWKQRPAQNGQAPGTGTAPSNSGPEQMPAPRVQPPGGAPGPEQMPAPRVQPPAGGSGLQPVNWPPR
jgi:outer membrane protein assembly factor BamD (BamD/ComL family)